MPCAGRVPGLKLHTVENGFICSGIILGKNPQKFTSYLITFVVCYSFLKGFRDLILSDCLKNKTSQLLVKVVVIKKLDLSHYTGKKQKTKYMKQS